jgi:hypothetical protein
MDNTEELKQLIRDFINLMRKFCPTSFANEMFALERRAKQLGV